MSACAQGHGADNLLHGCFHFCSAGARGISRWSAILAVVTSMTCCLMTKTTWSVMFLRPLIPYAFSVVRGLEAFARRTGATASVERRRREPVPHTRQRRPFDALCFGGRITLVCAQEGKALLNQECVRKLASWRALDDTRPLRAQPVMCLSSAESETRRCKGLLWFCATARLGAAYARAWSR